MSSSLTVVGVPVEPQSFAQESRALYNDPADAAMKPSMKRKRSTSISTTFSYTHTSPLLAAAVEEARAAPVAGKDSKAGPAAEEPPTRKQSRFRGVSWHRMANAWVAQIKTNGKNRYLGKFDDEAEASKAYESALTQKRLGNLGADAALATLATLSASRLRHPLVAEDPFDHQTAKSTTKQPDYTAQKSDMGVLQSPAVASQEDGPRSAGHRLKRRSTSTVVRDETARVLQSLASLDFSETSSLFSTSDSSIIGVTSSTQNEPASSLFQSSTSYSAPASPTSKAQPAATCAATDNSKRRRPPRRREKSRGFARESGVCNNENVNANASFVDSTSMNPSKRTKSEGPPPKQSELAGAQSGSKPHEPTRVKRSGIVRNERTSKLRLDASLLSVDCDSLSRDESMRHSGSRAACSFGPGFGDSQATTLDDRARPWEPSRAHPNNASPRTNQLRAANQLSPSLMGTPRAMMRSTSMEPEVLEYLRSSASASSPHMGLALSPMAPRSPLCLTPRYMSPLSTFAHKTPMFLASQGMARTRPLSMGHGALADVTHSQPWSSYSSQRPSPVISFIEQPILSRQPSSAIPIHGLSPALFWASQPSDLGWG